MLRPATPLSILFFIAFVLLLLSTLSTPIIQAIPLAQFDGVDFGVFGYCQNGKCSGMRVGYDTDKLFSAADNNEFSLPSSTRASLSSILIVHPVAALLTLICFALAVAAHFHSPAHSPRYLLALLILTFPTLLVALLAFLVDILLFVPHMQWGGWIVLAATILIIASGVVTCAMRRTLVSRKARKKRIAENAEMNGANYYNNLQNERLMADELPRADSPPPMNGSFDNSKGPQFASFETKSNERRSDDRAPLNPRAPSLTSNGTAPSARPMEDELPPMPVQPSDPYNMQHTTNPPMLMHQTSKGTLESQNSNRMGPPPPGYGRGRGGGYPPRGGYGPPPRGGFAPRGSYGPGPRGGYGPGRGGPQGMRGPPPPGWNGPQGRGMGPGPGPGPMAGPMMGRGQRGPPPGYSNDPLPPPGVGPFPRRNGSPEDPVNGEIIGQAIEMDERTGSPAINSPVRYGDHEMPGMVGVAQPLPRPRRDITPVNQRQPSGGEPVTPSSIYSESTYVQPRVGWDAPPLPRHAPAPMNNMQSAPPLSPVQASPTSRRNRAGSESYYEDVDPRFAADELSVVGVPTSLTPGPPIPTVRHPSPDHLRVGQDHDGPSLERDSSYENMAEGALSPAMSDTSNFTSVSQRGVNPNWRPPPGYGPGPGPVPGPSQQRRNERNDMILGQNPDFMLPGMRGPSRGGRGRGMPRPNNPNGLTPPGRYPSEM
ncbi:pali-domain-containing protein [Aureobasidium pullulans]|nr:pali-domain-containing protein [Aureobasidium pullulans]